MIGFKSQAQRVKFQQLVKIGKMDQKTYDLWDAATPKHIELPRRLSPMVNLPNPDPKSINMTDGDKQSTYSENLQGTFDLTRISNRFDLTKILGRDID